MFSTIVDVLKSLPILKEIGQGISKMVKGISHAYDKWKTRGKIKDALKEKDRAKAAKKINDQFRNW